MENGLGTILLVSSPRTGDKAEHFLVETLRDRRLKFGDTHPHTIESLNNLIELYEAWNKPEMAEKWRAPR